MEENAFELTMKTILVVLIVTLLMLGFYGFSFWLSHKEWVSNYEKIMSGDLSGCKYYSLSRAPLPCVKQLYND